MDVEVHIFLILALVGGEWSSSYHGPLSMRGETASDVHRWEAEWISESVWTRLRRFLAVPGLKLRPHGRLARVHSPMRKKYR
jgi:hypothetical protein